MKIPSTQSQLKQKQLPMQKIYNWMEPRMPLGLSPSTEFSAFAMPLIAAAIYSIGHFFLYFDYCLGGLYKDAKRTILYSSEDPYVSMLPFWNIAKDGYRGFLIIAVILIWAAWYHYHYHRQGSKSIYLMQRLPAKNELRKRCLTLPITAAAITAAIALALTAIYYICYITMTPEPFL